jgi:hypothetical protein
MTAWMWRHAVVRDQVEQTIAAAAFVFLNVMHGVHDRQECWRDRDRPHDTAPPRAERFKCQGVLTQIYPLIGQFQGFGHVTARIRQHTAKRLDFAQTGCRRA